MMWSEPSPGSQLPGILKEFDFRKFSQEDLASDLTNARNASE